MRSTNIIYSLLLLLLILHSCDADRKPLLPNVSGKSGEIMVVMNEPLWNSEVGTVIFDSLTKTMPATPQPEPIFDIFQIPFSGFTKSTQSHRNIIFVEVSDKYSKAEYATQKNRYAKPQLIVSLKAPDKQQMKELFNKNAAKIIQTFKHMERKRYLQYFKNNLKAEVVDKLKNNHQVKLTIPDGYYVNINKKDFIWIWHEDPKTLKGIFVYHYPYLDSSMFSRKSLIQTRNHYLKKYVPGRVEESYMITEDLYPPVYEPFTYKGNYYVEIRGLWKIKNGDFMGGPFISLTTLDEKRNRIVTAEGYVYAPQMDKKNMIRQLEAMIYSLEIQ